MEHQDSMSLMTCSFEEELAVRQCLFTKLSGGEQHEIKRHVYTCLKLIEYQSYEIGFMNIYSQILRPKRLV